MAKSLLEDGFVVDISVTYEDNYLLGNARVRVQYLTLVLLNCM